MKLLLINGASGTGKTTLAESLSGILDGWHWVHPDGLFPNTPEMGSVEILSKSLSWVRTNVRGRRIIIDCQIRPNDQDGVFRDYPVDSCETILLTCPRDIREQRLLDRGWSDDDFDRIANWASVLLNESEEAGMLVFDTSSESVYSICRKLESILDLNPE